MEKKKEEVKPYGLTVKLSFTFDTDKEANQFLDYFLPMLNRTLQHQMFGRQVREGYRYEKQLEVAEFEATITYQLRLRFVQNVFHIHGFLMHWASIHGGSIEVIELLAPEQVEND